jgi:hypothetical protein
VWSQRRFFVTPACVEVSAVSLQFPVDLNSPRDSLSLSLTHFLSESQSRRAHTPIKFLDDLQNPCCSIFIRVQHDIEK